MGFLDKLKHGWNAFIGEEDIYKNKRPYYNELGYSTMFRPDRVTFTGGNESSIVTAVYNRMAIDCSTRPVKQVKLDKQDRFKEVVKSELNYCLNTEANKDQQSRAFMQDVVMSLFDEGVVAIVPIDTSSDINKGTFNIHSMRTGKITQWYPDHVRVDVYNDKTGYREEITVPKKSVAIIDNPFYAVMNEKNSVLQRLIVKLNLLDVIDKQSGAGKLDLIIQLPYTIKTDARRAQAEKRRKDIEDQLEGSKYGITYTDGTEKVTQLNRPVENNLLKQIEYLTSMVYAQLSITTKVLDGTADEKTMLNYNNRTIEPILAAITLEYERKFLTKTARTKGNAIRYFNEPFRLVPIANLADIADKFTRNEILTSNEVRQIIGFKPIDKPEADELRNKNLNKPVVDGEVIKTDGDQMLEFRVVFTPDTGEKDAVLKAKSEEEVYGLIEEIGFSRDQVTSVTQV